MNNIRKLVQSVILGLLLVMVVPMAQSEPSKWYFTNCGTADLNYTSYDPEVAGFIKPKKTLTIVDPKGQAFINVRISPPLGKGFVKYQSIWWNCYKCTSTAGCSGDTSCSKKC